MKFWKSDEPENRSCLGGVAIIRNELTEWEFTMNQMNRPRGHTGPVTCTFWVESVTRDQGKYAYITRNNTFILKVPAR